MSNTPASYPDATPILKAPEGRMGISIEMVMEAYAKAEPPVPPEHLESICWLFRYARANKMSGNAAVGRLFKPPRDPSSISKLFSATYGAGLDRIIADIDKLRALVEQQDAVKGDDPIIPLKVTERIHTFAERVHLTGSMGFLWGPTGAGKTEAIKAHVRRVGTKRRVIKVDMPDGGAKGEFLDACLEAVGNTSRMANGDKKPAFMRHLNRRTELIIDEFHETWVTGALKVNTVEMIRRWHDVYGCSVLLVCTDTLEETLRDKRFAKTLAQTVGRGPWRRHIPTKPHPEDVAAIVGAYRLTPPVNGSQEARIVDELCDQAGLRLLCKYLQAARILAHHKNQVFAWSHVIDTYNVEAWGGEEGN